MKIISVQPLLGATVCMNINISEFISIDSFFAGEIEITLKLFQHNYVFVTKRIFIVTFK